VAFAAYLAVSPVCQAADLDDAQMGERPIRIFDGRTDPSAPGASCRALIDRLRAAGKDVQLTEYPGAPHPFDVPDRQAVEAVRAFLTATFEPPPTPLSMTDAPRPRQSR
jgi:dienelactone hydrolase